MAGRISQDVVEVSELGVPNARASQVVAEVDASGTPAARASQVVAEVDASGTPAARASQIVAEVDALGSPVVRISQLVVEVLLRSIAVAQPPLYPSLPGLAYSVFWTPQFFNQSEQAASGAEFDLALASTPIHEFELSYNFLRGGLEEGGTEFKTMFGFFLSMGGSAGRFLFPNPHDSKVTGQALATTDGVASVFGPITRTFGIGPNSGTEPVGYVDTTSTLNVYLDGVLQDPDSYQILQAAPGNQQLKFNNTPAAGQAITLDFSFFYYCKFGDPKLQFEEFLNNVWSLQKVVVRSCRAGT